MSRLIWPVTAVAATAILTAGIVTSARVLRPPVITAGAGHSPSPAGRLIPAARTVAATRLETNPGKALLIAEKAVGNCLEGAWGDLGYTNVFDKYLGNGVVEFSTGSQANPTGSTANRTLIRVKVFSNRAVTDNAALRSLGCQPYKSDYIQKEPIPTDTPSGMQHDGPLDVKCRLRGTPGYTSFYALVDIYNPGSSAQTVSQFAISWGSNGILLSQQTFDGPWTIAPGEDNVLTLDDPPGSANSCVFAGWNP